MSISPIATTSSENIHFPYTSHAENISNQETNLQARIKSAASRMAYKTYSFFHHPGTLPPERVAEALYEETKKKILGKKPESYEECRARYFPVTDKSHLTKISVVEIYTDPDFYKLIGPYSDPEFRKKAELYADPEYRKAQARKHIEKPLQIEQKEQWYVLSFCEEELHVIYEQEPEHLKKYIANDIWMLNRYNREALAKHKHHWDSLSPSEKMKAFFGDSKKYKIAAGVTTTAGCFFLYYHMHVINSRYQQLLLVP